MDIKIPFMMLCLSNILILLALKGYMNENDRLKKENRYLRKAK